MSQAAALPPSMDLSFGVFLQIPLPRDARDLMDRLLCDVDDRLGSNGVQELKVSCNWAHTRFVLREQAKANQLNSAPLRHC